MTGRTFVYILVLACAACATGPQPVGPVRAPQLGNGTRGSAQVVSIYSPRVQREATDLAFDPATGRLWVVLREYASNSTCTENVPSGCASRQGRTLEIVDAGGATPTSQLRQDTNAWHFMRRPTGIAFGEADERATATAGASQFFATCHEDRTGNYDDDPVDYIGPSLWTSDPAVYAITGPGGNGSHLDMVHTTPFCMGVAHKTANVFFVFNGNVGSIDEVDFATPHVAGGDDHSNGRVRRFTGGGLTRLPNVPSHMAFDAETGYLYIADTGNGRITRLDTATGTMGGRFTPAYDSLSVSNLVQGATFEDVVAPGTLVEPSGLELFDNMLFVTDHATSVIYAFSLSGELLNQFDTELPEGALSGITIGLDNKVYFVNQLTSEVYRLDSPS